MTTAAGPLRLLKYYTLFAFFVIGVITVLLGQVLPILSANLKLNDAESGVLLFAQFTGALLGTLLVGPLMRRWGFGSAALIGLVLMMTGLPGLNAGEFVLCWIAIFTYGTGIGVAIPAINLLTIEVTPEGRQTSAVNLLNFTWGLGAICSQPFVAAVSRENSLVSVTLTLCIALLVLVICFLTVARSLRLRPIDEAEGESGPRIWRRPEAWLFLLFGFFVVGVEGGMSGWLTSYSETLRAAGGSAVNATVVYFSFFVLGRGVASVVSKHVSENYLISVCAALLCLGISIIVASESMVLAGAAIAGLGSSALFPTNIVRFTKVFGPTATRQAAPIFIAGTCGAASVTTLVGFVSHRSGSLRWGIAVILLSAALVVVLQAVIALVSSAKMRTQ